MRADRLHARGASRRARGRRGSRACGSSPCPGFASTDHCASSQASACWMASSICRAACRPDLAAEHPAADLEHGDARTGHRAGGRAEPRSGRGRGTRTRRLACRACPPSRSRGTCWWKLRLPEDVLQELARDGDAGAVRGVEPQHGELGVRQVRRPGAIGEARALVGDRVAPVARALRTRRRRSASASCAGEAGSPVAPSASRWHAST